MNEIHHDMPLGLDPIPNHLLLPQNYSLGSKCLNPEYPGKFDPLQPLYNNLEMKNNLHAANHKDLMHLENFGKPPSAQGHHPFSNNNRFEKPYKCETCKKSFTQQSNLCKHYLIHTGIKPYTCDMCNKSFTQQANLVKHRRIHTGDKPFGCEICGRYFSQKANLQKHELLHTGEKKHRCHICSKSFVQQSNLERHKKTHTGEKPYSCVICDRRFTQKSNLTKHMIVHNVHNVNAGEALKSRKMFKKKPSRRSNYGSDQDKGQNVHEPTISFTIQYDGYQLKNFGVPVLLSTKDGLVLKRL